MHSIKKMVLKWKTNYQLEAENEKGLSVSFDAPIDHGGEETALSPMENVLASLAVYSSFHVLRIVKKMRSARQFFFSWNKWKFFHNSISRCFQ